MSSDPSEESSKAWRVGEPHVSLTPSSADGVAAARSVGLAVGFTHLLLSLL